MSPPLPPLSPPGWTQDQAIAYEVARELVGDVIALCTAQLAAERERPSPDAALIGRLEQELAALLAERDALRVLDDEAVARARAVHGARLRRHLAALRDSGA